MHGNTYPIYESLPADIERRRLDAAEKMSAPRSSVVMWPLAAEIIEAEPIVADEVPQSFHNAELFGAQEAFDSAHEARRVGRWGSLR